jgi:hypothetical protein
LPTNYFIRVFLLFFAYMCIIFRLFEFHFAYLCFISLIFVSFRLYCFISLIFVSFRLLFLFNFAYFCFISLIFVRVRFLNLNYYYLDLKKMDCWLIRIRVFCVSIWQIFLNKLGFDCEHPKQDLVLELVNPVETCLKKKSKHFFKYVP